MNERLERAKTLAMAGWSVMALVFRTAPLLASGLALSQLVGQALFLASAVGLQRFGEAAVARGSVPWDWVIVIAAAAAISLGLTWVGTPLRIILVDRAQMVVEQRILEIERQIVGIEHHERPEFIDKVVRLRLERQIIGTSIDGVLLTAITLLGFAGTGALLLSVHPVLLLVLASTAVGLTAGARAEGRRDRIQTETIESSRLAGKLVELIASPTVAREHRLFGVGDLLSERRRFLARDVHERMQQVERRAAAETAVGWAVFAVVAWFALSFLVREVRAGGLSVGGLILALALIGRLSQQGSQTTDAIVNLVQRLRSGERLLWLAERMDTGDGQLVEAGRGIGMRGVRFRYPETDHEVLQGLDLDLEPGSVVALVGPNGAGKTSLAKLLLRYYRATDGEVSVGGVGADRVDVDDWRRHCSACFQDPVEIQFTVRDTVAMGDLSDAEDPDRLRQALEEGGGRTLVERLPRGLDTPLGRSFPDGRQLSGGEWQRLALSRASMRRRVSLLVLDEPSSSLDPEIEAEIHARYAERSEARGQGVVLFVSHRFSTVRMADLILVMDKGRIVERGTHGELMRADGLYAEMFRVQAAGYQE